MLDSFDPKEKKAILVFIACLILGAIYLSSNRDQSSSPSFERQVEGGFLKPRRNPPLRAVISKIKAGRIQGRGGFS